MLCGWPASSRETRIGSGQAEPISRAGLLAGIPKPREFVLDRRAFINDRLIRYFPMKEGAGTSLTDLCVGTAGPFPASGISWSAGPRGCASILSDGTSQIAVANPTATDLPNGASAKSMSIWLRASSIAGAFAWGAAYGLAGVSQTMMIGRWGTALYGAFYANDLTVSSFWTIGTWCHIVLTYDGTTAFLYVDGVLRTQGAKTLNLVRSQFYIGNMVSGAERWLGDIAQLRIYARCLSQYDITQLFINPWAGVL